GLRLVRCLIGRCILCEKNRRRSDGERQRDQRQTRFHDFLPVEKKTLSGTGRGGKAAGRRAMALGRSDRQRPHLVLLCLPKRPLRVPGLPSLLRPTRGATCSSAGNPSSSASSRRI